MLILYCSSRLLREVELLVQITEAESVPIFVLRPGRVRDGGQRGRGRRRPSADGAGVAAAEGQPGDGRVVGEHAPDDPAVRRRKFERPFLLSVYRGFYYSINLLVGIVGYIILNTAVWVGCSAI